MQNKMERAEKHICYPKKHDMMLNHGLNVCYAHKCI